MEREFYGRSEATTPGARVMTRLVRPSEPAPCFVRWPDQALP